MISSKVEVRTNSVRCLHYCLRNPNDFARGPDLFASRSQLTVKLLVGHWPLSNPSAAWKPVCRGNTWHTLPIGSYWFVVLLIGLVQEDQWFTHSFSVVFFVLLTDFEHCRYGYGHDVQIMEWLHSNLKSQKVQVVPTWIDWLVAFLMEFRNVLRLPRLRVGSISTFYERNPYMKILGRSSFWQCFYQQKGINYQSKWRNFFR